MSGCHCGMAGSQYCEDCPDNERCHKDSNIIPHYPSWMYSEKGTEEAMEEFYKEMKEEDKQMRNFFYNL